MKKCRGSGENTICICFLKTLFHINRYVQPSNIGVGIEAQRPLNFFAYYHIPPLLRLFYLWENNLCSDQLELK